MYRHILALACLCAARYPILLFVICDDITSGRVCSKLNLFERIKILSTCNHYQTLSIESGVKAQFNKISNQKTFCTDTAKPFLYFYSNTSSVMSETVKDSNPEDTRLESTDNSQEADKNPVESNEGSIMEGWSQCRI